MMLPEIVDIIKVKEWLPVMKKMPDCYLYDFKSLGIEPYQLSDIIVGREAILFEKPFKDRLAGRNCPWCEVKTQRREQRGSRLQDHIFTHSHKTILSYQLVKFQKEMHTLRLQLVRQGYHEALSFFVDHSCQDCLNPVAEGRKGMCALPVASRSRMRSLKILGYPIKHLTKNKKRKYQWSALGLIVLLKTEVTENLDLPMKLVA